LYDNLVKCEVLNVHRDINKKSAQFIQAYRYI